MTKSEQVEGAVAEAVVAPTGTTRTGRRAWTVVIATVAAIGVLVGAAAVVGEGEPGADVVAQAPASDDVQDDPAVTGSSVDVPTPTTQPPAAPARCRPEPSAGQLPSARFGAVVVPEEAGFVVHGGRGPDFVDHTDTWVADCAGWQRRQPTRRPPAFEPGDGVAAFDGARNESVLLTSTGTWVWKGNDWTLRTKDSPRLVQPGLVFDGARNELVAFGSTGRVDEPRQTWAWDGSAWSRRSTDVTPPAREGGALVFDAARGRTYLIGGMAGPDKRTDTWSWDGRSWKELQPTGGFTGGPVTAAYDAARGVTVALVFDGAGRQAETWTFDGVAWKKATTVRTPPRRLFGSMAYVPAFEQVVLFGGKVNRVVEEPQPHAEEEVVNDLWTWDGKEWRQLR